MNLINAIAKAPTIEIRDVETSRRLLTLKVVDGKLTAEYDDADLDEAARVFVRELLRTANSLDD